MSELPQSDQPKEKLGDFMTTPVISIDVKATVQDAAHLMGSEGASAILTTENGVHVGIITERDFTRKVVGEGLSLSTPVSEIMSCPLYTLDRNLHILEAAESMTDRNTRHITVTEDGKKVVGIITVKNTFSYYMNLFGLGSYDPTTSAD
jgi:signal-transduction protein with cAMP-binding, CBS, and nucleotidyltransferase domain